MLSSHRMHICIFIWGKPLLYEFKCFNFIGIFWVISIFFQVDKDALDM